MEWLFAITTSSIFGQVIIISLSNRHVQWNFVHNHSIKSIQRRNLCIPQPLSVVSSENFVLASEIQSICLTCQKVIAKLESARSDNTKDNGEITNKEIEAKTFQSTNSFFWVVIMRRDWDLVMQTSFFLQWTYRFQLVTGQCKEKFCAVEELVGKAQLETTALAFVCK